MREEGAERHREREIEREKTVVTPPLMLLIRY